MNKKGKHYREWTPIDSSKHGKRKTYIQRLPGKVMGSSILIPDLPPRASRGGGVGISPNFGEIPGVARGGEDVHKN